MSALELKAVDRLWDLTGDIQVELRKAEDRSDAIAIKLDEMRAWLEAFMANEESK